MSGYVRDDESVGCDQSDIYCPIMSVNPFLPSVLFILNCCDQSKKQDWTLNLVDVVNSETLVNVLSIGRLNV